MTHEEIALKAKELSRYGKHWTEWIPSAIAILADENRTREHEEIMEALRFLRDDVCDVEKAINRN